MRLTNYDRTPRAVFLSSLLLSQHVIVDAKYWFAGRSRSSTLAVAAPGGRDRPIRDWKAISRNAKKKVEESEQHVAKNVEGAIEALEQAPLETSTVDVEETDDAEAITADPLDLEKGTPQSLAILLSKVALVTTVGIYVAKKAVSFTKAFIKSRKEAASETLAVGLSPEPRDEAEDQAEEEEEGEEGEGDGELAVADDDDDEDEVQ